MEMGMGMTKPVKRQSEFTTCQGEEVIKNNDKQI